MLKMSPVAIRDLGNLIVSTAIEQTAKDAGVPTIQILEKLRTDESVTKRVQDYIKAGYDFAMSKA